MLLTSEIGSQKQQQRTFGRSRLSPWPPRMSLQHLALLIALGALLRVQLEARCLGSYYFSEEGVPGIQHL
jgi:hypothetical protein